MDCGLSTSHRQPSYFEVIAAGGQRPLQFRHVIGFSGSVSHHRQEDWAPTIRNWAVNLFMIYLVTYRSEPSTSTSYDGTE